MTQEILAFVAVLVVCGTCAFLGSFRILVQFLEHKRDRSNPATLAAFQERLERIDATVQATALEVERVSEANRFLTKLLADRSPASPDSRQGRVITPH